MFKPWCGFRLLDTMSDDTMGKKINTHAPGDASDSTIYTCLNDWLVVRNDSWDVGTP